MPLRLLLLLMIALSLIGCSEGAAQSGAGGEVAAPATAASTAGQANAASNGSIDDFPKLSAESDWPWWRGPQRNGIASSAVPTTWSESDNVVWKASVPGRGHSSPIVVGNRVFLATADEKEQIQSLLAFDRATGRQLWQTEISRGGFPARIHNRNTHASPTAACDGERVFITFFHHDTLQTTALDLDGKQLWQKTVSPFRYKRYEYGYAASPVLYKNVVIVAGESDDNSFIKALDRKSGDEVWSTPRPKNITYSTPVVAHLAGRDQLFLSGADKIASYDPASGKELWSTPGTPAATCGTAVWDGDLIFASGGYPSSETVAVKADGSGRVWKNGQNCYEQSMLAVDGHLYALTGGGVVFCWRTSDGKEMWKHRLRGPVSASPVFAGGLIYWSNERGTTYVFKTNPAKFELVAENQLEKETMASPAVSRGNLFLRVADAPEGASRRETLYCLGE